VAGWGYGVTSVHVAGWGYGVTSVHVAGWGYGVTSVHPGTFLERWLTTKNTPKSG
jgi:hypothetical protein